MNISKILQPIQSMLMWNHRNQLESIPVPYKRQLVSVPHLGPQEIPNAGSSSAIKNSLRILHGSGMQKALVQNQARMVLKIEPVLFSLVILDLNAHNKTDACSPRHLVTYICPPLHSGDSADLHWQYELSVVLM